MESVSKRDFETFETFFDRSLEFFAVLPGGRTFDSVDSFMESQTFWFNGTTGKFEYEIRNIQNSDDLGFAHVLVTYSNVDSENVPFILKIYISFNFKKKNGSWFLIYDQNTVLSKE